MCLGAEGAVFAASQDAVVVVQRSAATGGEWEPLATMLQDHGGAAYLCAEGVTALGEFGLGGSASAFPVGSEPGPGAEPLAPEAGSLRAYPNPTRGMATVEIVTPEAGEVRVAVFDALGREVARLHAGPLAAGVHPLALDTSRLPVGRLHRAGVHARGGAHAAADRRAVGWDGLWRGPRQRRRKEWGRDEPIRRGTTVEGVNPLPASP